MRPYAVVGRVERPTVSVVIPALDEAATIASLVRLVRDHPRVREVLVIDDGSVDGTAEVARDAGAQVVLSSLLGKGASMTDGLRLARGPVVLFLDGDLLHVNDDLVALMTDPILQGDADLVKAGFSRDGGRVTVLTARPLLAAFFPEIAEFSQPLGGIVAGRKSLFDNIRLEDDYGVDIALLIDAGAREARMVEVDIGHIDHESQSLQALGEMAKQVTRVILDRAWRYERLSVNQVMDMRETERRSKAGSSHLFCAAEGRQQHALLGMDGILLDGCFVVRLAEQMGVVADLQRLLSSKLLPEHDRMHAVASVFVGVAASISEEVAREMPLVEGAVEIVRELRRAGYRVGIVSDSFHIAAETVRRRVFADFAVAHVMHFHNGVAIGEVSLAPAMVAADGCRRHTYCKANVIRRLAHDVGSVARHTLAVGTDEKDICLLRLAGRAVAFRPTSKWVAQAADLTVEGSLLGVMEALGEERRPYLRATALNPRGSVPYQNRACASPAVR